MALQQKYLAAVKPEQFIGWFFKKKNLILFFTQLHHNCNNG